MNLRSKRGKSVICGAVTLTLPEKHQAVVVFLSLPLPPPHL